MKPKERAISDGLRRWSVFVLLISRQGFEIERKKDNVDAKG